MRLITCSACRNKNALNRSLCLSCGAELAKEENPFWSLLLRVVMPFKPLWQRITTEQLIRDWNHQRTLMATGILMVSLIGFGAFHHYVIFMPRLERTRIEREAQERAKQKEENRAKEVAEEKVREGLKSIEEREKAKRDLEQAQAGFETQLREEQARQAERQEEENRARVALAKIEADRKAELQRLAIEQGKLNALRQAIETQRQAVQAQREAALRQLAIQQQQQELQWQQQELQRQQLEQQRQQAAAQQRQMQELIWQQQLPQPLIIWPPPQPPRTSFSCFRVGQFINCN